MNAPGRAPDQLSEQAALALRTAYLDLFSLACRMMDRQVPAPRAAQLRKQVEASLQDHRDQLFSARVPKSLVNKVQLPVICLLDEAAKRDPAFGQAWGEMQHAGHGNLEGGEVFFQQLKEHLANPGTPVEVLEVYARCLFLGFQGMDAGDAGAAPEPAGSPCATTCAMVWGRCRRSPLTCGRRPRGARFARSLAWHWVGVISILLLSVLALGLRISLSFSVEEVRGVIDSKNPATAAESAPGPGTEKVGSGKGAVEGQR